MLGWDEGSAARTTQLGCRARSGRDVMLLLSGLLAMRVLCWGWRVPWFLCVSIDEGTQKLGPG